jgi:hypothetical protein
MRLAETPVEGSMGMCIYLSVELRPDSVRGAISDAGIAHTDTVSWYLRLRETSELSPVSKYRQAVHIRHDTKQRSIAMLCAFFFETCGVYKYIVTGSRSSSRCAFRIDGQTIDTICAICA